MKTIRSAEDLTNSQLSQAPIEELQNIAERFQISITPAMIERIHSGSDAVARQFIPHKSELTTTSDEMVDPIGDETHSPTKGLIHRYPDRVLIKPLHTCAVYCRFCFRREKVGNPDSLSKDDIKTALSYIRRHNEIWEVIFSGGDPLLLSDDKLQQWMSAIADIDHIGSVRFHTRVPVVKPERINDKLIETLKSCGKAVFIVIHSNHADEFNNENRTAIAQLVDNGIPLLSQSVLLKGINDKPETLESLMRCFVSQRIKPYYLHHGDLAPGTSHFRTTIQEGQDIMRQLRGRLSGIAQPLYVIDIPGGYGKVPALPIYLQETDKGWQIEDWQNGLHSYCDSCSTPNDVI